MPSSKSSLTTAIALGFLSVSVLSSPLPQELPGDLKQLPQEPNPDNVFHLLGASITDFIDQGNPKQKVELNLTLTGNEKVETCTGQQSRSLVKHEGGMDLTCANKTIIASVEQLEEDSKKGFSFHFDTTDHSFSDATYQAQPGLPDWTCGDPTPIKSVDCKLELGSDGILVLSNKQRGATSSIPQFGKAESGKEEVSEPGEPGSTPESQATSVDGTSLGPSGGVADPSELAFILKSARVELADARESFSVTVSGNQPSDLDVTCTGETPLDEILGSDSSRFPLTCPDGSLLVEARGGRAMNIMEIKEQGLNLLFDYSLG
ncbi:MAG: hypothetical protein M1833_002251 [Piccolia ochrophora]|nr:MAG: hypothetical protein M1833_002251 [Piccolia ochrophora]